MMPDAVPALPFPTPPTAVPPDVIYAALGDPRRRRILQCLADGKARTATELKTVAGKRLDATLKHLVALRQSGLVVTLPNAADGRRQLYGLSPHVAVKQTETGGWEMDFGCCVVRF